MTVVGLDGGRRCRTPRLPRRWPAAPLVVGGGAAPGRGGPGRRAAARHGRVSGALAARLDARAADDAGAGRGAGQRRSRLLRHRPARCASAGCRRGCCRRCPASRRRSPAPACPGTTRSWCTAHGRDLAAGAERLPGAAAGRGAHRARRRAPPSSAPALVGLDRAGCVVAEHLGTDGERIHRPATAEAESRRRHLGRTRTCVLGARARRPALGPGLGCARTTSRPPRRPAVGAARGRVRPPRLDDHQGGGAGARARPARPRLRRPGLGRRRRQRLGRRRVRAVRRGGGRRRAGPGAPCELIARQRGRHGVDVAVVHRTGARRAWPTCPTRTRSSSAAAAPTCSRAVRGPPPGPDRGDPRRAGPGRAGRRALLRAGRLRTSTGVPAAVRRAPRRRCPAGRSGSPPPTRCSSSPGSARDRPRHGHRRRADRAVPAASARAPPPPDGGTPGPRRRLAARPPASRRQRRRRAAHRLGRVRRGGRLPRHRRGGPARSRRCSATSSTDPAVVCVDEAGRYAVALLGGHAGGANDLAGGSARARAAAGRDHRHRRGRRARAGHARLAGRAGAVARGVPGHRWTASRSGLVADADLAAARPAADTVARRRARRPSPTGVAVTGDAGTDRVVPLDGRTAVLRPPSLVAGVGASRGVPAAEVRGAAATGCSPRPASPGAVRALPGHRRRQGRRGGHRGDRRRARRAPADPSGRGAGGGRRAATLARWSARRSAPPASPRRPRCSHRRPARRAAGAEDRVARWPPSRSPGTRRAAGWRSSASGRARADLRTPRAVAELRRAGRGGRPRPVRRPGPRPARARAPGCWPAGSGAEEERARAAVDRGHAPGTRSR